MTTWQSQGNPPVPNTPAKYWETVSQIVAGSAFRQQNVAVRSAQLLYHQPPTSRQSGAMLNRGGPVGGFPN